MPSWIAEDYEPPSDPNGSNSGEPDVGGTTSPASIGPSHGEAEVQPVPQDLVRLAVWFWRTRFVMTGF